MNLMKIVNYKSAKAFYKVEYNNDRSFVATLEKYMGDDAQMPPRKVSFIKDTSPTTCKKQQTPSLLEDVTKAVTKK